MVTLNLKANTPEEQIVLKHLIPQVSDVLAEKINNGVRIKKDGKTLINKKDLSTFMQYATEQAKKQIAENQRKGAQAVCVQGDDIMNWAIHYFEEDSIEGKLYNVDGTEYKPPKPAAKPVATTTPAVPYTPPKPAPKPQLNIFDMMADSPEPKAEIPEPEQRKQEQVKQINPVYEEYLKIQERYPEFVIAYRLGDFYEIFGEDAKKISDDLDMTLTGRDFGLESRIPMIGIPQHAIKSYITRITEYGHKLAVVENKDNIRRFVLQNNQTVEIDTGEIMADDVEELSVEEMRQFDGDITEPEELPTVSKITEGIDFQDSDDDFDIENERRKMKAFDLEALIILQELFDNKINVV